jgi:predicted methyltransferase MtxX (methanogen marker protein 4)
VSFLDSSDHFGFYSTRFPTKYQRSTHAVKQDVGMIEQTLIKDFGVGRVIVRKKAESEFMLDLFLGAGIQIWLKRMG